MTTRPRPVPVQVHQLLAETGSSDPREAVRLKARALIAQFADLFGPPTMPIDVYVLASMIGIGSSTERPVHSKDAELVPDGTGGVTMRVNPDRPETRRRFSVGHEISHTFFPGYELKVQCRPDPEVRDRDDPGEVIETLCDIGAAEIILPTPWFTDDARNVRRADGIVNLANRYRASRHATIRRFAETSRSCVAAVFLSWKLKPTQAKSFNPDQGNLFGTDPHEDLLASRELRIDYAIPSEKFAETGLYLPKDKSVEVDQVLGAATNGACADGECSLDLGAAEGSYKVMAIPLYTTSTEAGPNGESAIAAIIEPISSNRRKQTKKPESSGLF